MKIFENKIRRRASFEIFPGHNSLHFFYDLKFKFNRVRLKTISENEKMENKNSFAKIFLAKFTLILLKRKNFDFKSIFQLPSHNKFNVSNFKNFYFHFNLFLKTKFIHLVNFNNYYLNNDKTKKQKNLKQKNEVVLKINSVKIQIYIIKNCIKFYQINYNIHFSHFLIIPNFYYFVNSICSKNSLCKILFIKNLILDKIIKINPEYFQIIISCITVKKLLNLIDLQCLFWINFIFFIIKEICVLISNECYCREKKNKRNFFLLNFIFIVYNSNFFEFVFKKILINKKNSYIYYQNLEIFFDIIKYIKNFSILIKFNLKHILKHYHYICVELKTKYYFYILINFLFGKKLIFLTFYFSEKLSRHLNNQRLIKINLLDKFFYKFFRLFAIGKFKNNSNAINKFVVLLFELISKNNCIYLNLFFINEIYKIFIEKKINKCRKKTDKSYCSLDLKIYEFIYCIDEYKLPLYLTKFLHNVVLKKKFCLDYLINVKKKFALSILVKSFELFNLKTFKLFRIEASLLGTNINFHCFNINQIKKKKILLEKTIVKTLNFIFIIYLISIITQNYKKSFFFRFLLNRKNFHFCKKNYYLKILKHLCNRIILILIEKKSKCSIISSILMNLKFVPVKLLINFYQKKPPLYFISIYNFSKDFSYIKSEISMIEILCAKLYSIIIKKKLYLNFLKNGIFLDLKNNFYNILVFFYYFLNLYFLQKNKIKLYLISTSYFIRIFNLVLLGNINNFLPQFMTGYILMKQEKNCKKLLHKLNNFIDLNIEWACMNKKIKKKWSFYTRHLGKMYILFFKIFYFKNNLLIGSFGFLKWERNFINLINTYNQYYKNLLFKKYLNNVKKISTFSTKHIMFLLHVFVINQFVLDKSTIHHILLDKKSNFIFSKLKKFGLKIKKNLSTIRNASPFTFFNSIQTRIFFTSF
jgi:hypothetical protein